MLLVHFLAKLVYLKLNASHAQSDTTALRLKHAPNVLWAPTPPILLALVVQQHAVFVILVLTALDAIQDIICILIVV